MTNKTVRNKVFEIRDWLGEGSINIFGKPFAGKDVHANKLAQAVGGNVLGGGQILRNSEIPKDVRDSMNRGELIPSQDFASYVTPYLSSDELAGKPIMLSSVGRVSGEEEGVIEAMQKAGHPIKSVVHLDITPDESFRRMSASNRGRDDDTEDTLRVRFDEFGAKTRPVLESYAELGLLVTVDAMSVVPVVYAKIVNAIHAQIS